MGEQITLLLYLADKGALDKEITLSTIEISKDTGISQQTISRKLIELEKKGFIDRNASTRGVRIRLNEKGKEELRNLYLKLRNAFGEKRTILEGKVESGLGEGSYYLSLKEYNNQFKKKLGIDPYKGTLNVRVNYNELLQFLNSQNKVIIDGFKTGNRTFGSIIAYKIKLNGIDSAIIIPERTSHDKDMIEIISETSFRKKLSLKDKDTVKITI